MAKTSALFLPLSSSKSPFLCIEELLKTRVRSVSSAHLLLQPQPSADGSGSAVQEAEAAVK